MRYILLLIVLMVSCKSTKQGFEKNIVDNTQNRYTKRYNIDLISSENSASKIAEIIWTEKYKNDDIQLYKPFEVVLIEDGKVWEVIGSSSNKGNVIKRTYRMKINKNTGEVIRNWVEK